MAVRSAPKPKSSGGLNPQIGRNDHRIEKLKQQQRVWMTEMAMERQEISDSPYSEECVGPSQDKPSIQSESESSLLLKNWCQSISKETISVPKEHIIDISPHQTPLDELECEICLQMMRLPVLLAPCGHSFCEECIEARKYQSLDKVCYCCGQSILHTVPNMSLRRLLASSPKSSLPSQIPSKSLGNQVVNFDEDPANLVEIYKMQHEQLSKRCLLIEGEHEQTKSERDMIENEIAVSAECVSESLQEMVVLEGLVSQYQLKITELKDQIMKNQDKMNCLSKQLTPLKEKEILAKETLNVLRKRKEKIKSLEAKLNSLIVTAEDNIARTESITSHMKNVTQELNHTQALYDAKTRQIETEEHFKQLSEREAGRLGLEIKRLGTNISEVTDQLNSLQNDIYRGNEKIEAIRTELKLENEELTEWLRVQAEKEEDNLALIKYSKEDESKIKELNLSIEKFVQEVNKKKALLNAEVTETQIAQIELDKTTEAFKQLHQERQDLISQWETAIKNMEKRDQDIQNCQTLYQEQKEKIRESLDTLRERQEFLNQQLEQNSEIEKNIGHCERSVSKFREEQSESILGLQQYRDEVEVLRNTLNKSATDLVNKKSELTNLKEDLQDKQVKLEKSRKTYEDLKKKLVSLDDQTISMEAKAKQIQDMLDKQEAKDKDLDRQIRVLRESQFRKSQELFKLRQDEKNLAAEILGGEAASKNLKAKIHQLDQESLKQRAMLYTMDFQVQQLERKLRRAQGDRTNEEKEILMKRLEELTKDSENQNAKWTLLNNQLKRSQEDLRHAKRQLENNTKTKNTIINNIEELNMYNESASHQLSAKVKEKEDLMVEENILRLELRKLRGFLNVRADEVFSLESRQVQIQLALEERTKEIDIHKDMLRVQLKNAEEERHSATAELRDRIGKVEKLKKRYEILMTQFAPEEGEEEHTQAYYVIKAAQRREELQREGDELDANIRRAEKEIKALENTLKLMNDRNESYRMNMYKAELDSKDIQHKEMLEIEYRQVMENYKVKREQIQDLQQKLQLLEQELNEVSNSESQSLHAVQVLEARIQAIRREVEDQQVKCNRASKFVTSAAKKIRQTRGSSINKLTPEEKDFQVRKLREVGTAVMTELKRVGSKLPEFNATLQSLMQEYNISPPSRALSRVSSRAESVVSDDVSENGWVVGEDGVAKSRGSSRSESRAYIKGSTPITTQDDQVQKSTEDQTGSRRVSTTNINDMSGLPPLPNSQSKSSLTSKGKYARSDGSRA